MLSSSRETAAHGLVPCNLAVYCVALDTTRGLVYSGSMDCTVRVWDLLTGACKQTMTEHASLIGLLRLSPSYLVSGSADATLRVWDPDTGALLHTLALTSPAGAVTCFMHDDRKIISGSVNAVREWDIRTGEMVRDMLHESEITKMMGKPTDVWQVAFEGRICVAACGYGDKTMLHVWQFTEGHGDNDVL